MDQVPASSSLLRPPTHYTNTTHRVPITYNEALRLTLRCSGPRTSLLLIVLGGSLRVWVGDWHWFEAVSPLVLMFGWALLEWALHGYLLHGRPLPLTGWRISSTLAHMHHKHHEDPWDFGTLHYKGRTILLAWAVCMLVSSLLCTLRIGLTLSTIFLVLVEIHQWCHLLTHSKIQVRSPFLRRLVKNHIDHHVVDQRKWLGVTSFWADAWLGTGGTRTRSPGPLP